MRGKTLFVAGLAIGYVLGAKAGRERYEQIARAGRKIRSSPSVQEATGLVQAQTTRLLSTGRDVVRDQMQGRFSDSRFTNSRLGQRILGESDELTFDEPPRSHTQGF